MAVVTPDILALTLAGLETNFDQAYNDAKLVQDWDKFASELPTTLPTQKYGWLGRGPVMEEFVDRPRQQEINEFVYSLSDKLYKAEMDIERTALEDDQYGLLMKRAQRMGAEPPRHWTELAYGALNNGFSSLCYDGQNFFDDSHQEGDSPTQTNVTSDVLSKDALATAEATMLAYQDDKAKPLTILPNLLIVGPSNKETAWELTVSAVVVTKPDTTSGRSGTNYANYWQGRLDVLVSPYLVGSAAAHWYLCDTTKYVKPIILQSRSDVPITLESDMMEAHAKIRENYKFTARGRYAVGYGLWQCAYGSNA